MKIAIGIPSVGRPELLKKVINRLELQTRKADAVFVCPASDDDVAGIEFDGSTNLIRIDSDKGLTKQRNAILRNIYGFDLIVYLEDDFVVHKDCLLEIEKEFSDNEDTVVATGSVVADGAKGPGLSLQDVESYADNAEIIRSRKEVFSTYGFIAVRMDVVRKNNLCFEEAFPFYGWLEDLDFSRSIAQFGKCIYLSGAVGAHMGHKGGRISGLRYGYSQVANPLFIAKKGNGFTYVMAIKMFVKNIIVNVVKSFYPEAYIDRKGRLKGNAIAIKDLITSCLDPRKIEKM